ncbi:MAG: isochorismatase family protein [Methanobacteriota archaeon]
MRDANYVTARNLAQKSAEWIALAEGRCRAKENFHLVPEGSALLVIDMQRFFTDSLSHAYIPAVDAILPNVQALIGAYRKRCLPVIFTRHAFLSEEDPGILGKWWRDALLEGDEYAEVDPRVAPDKGELVLRKNRYSAFSNPRLEKKLRGGKIGQIVIAGVMTHLCCETTARDAFMRDFEAYFTVDATATDDEELHCATLQTLSSGFAVPVSTAEVLRIMGERR